MTTYIGIDPGAAGAVAVLVQPIPEEEKPGPPLWVIDMPPNPRDLVDAIRDAPVGGIAGALVVLERQGARPGQGVSSVFKIGQRYGEIVGVLAALGLSYVEVMPGVWKRYMGLTGKDKEASRAMARQLWPDAPLARKKDEGRAEALLIAEYARRKGL